MPDLVAVEPDVDFDFIVALAADTCSNFQVCTCHSDDRPGAPEGATFWTCPSVNCGGTCKGDQSCSTINPNSWCGFQDEGTCTPGEERSCSMCECT